MSESKKRTLLVTALFSVTAVCLFATFFLQMQMKSTLAQISAVKATEVQTAEAPRTSAMQTVSASVSDTENPLYAVTSQDTQTPATVRRTEPSAKTEKTTASEKPKQLSEQLVVNTNTKKIHSPDCSFAKNIKPENRAEITAGDLQGYLGNGYTLCGHCEGCAK